MADGLRLTRATVEFYLEAQRMRTQTEESLARDWLLLHDTCARLREQIVTLRSDGALMSLRERAALVAEGWSQQRRERVAYATYRFQIAAHIRALPLLPDPPPESP